MVKNLCVGDQVTTSVITPAYYSGYASRPVQSFAPGMVGTVAVVRSPKVFHLPGRSLNSVLVDFEGEAYGPPHARSSIWRVALEPNDVVRVSENVGSR